MRNARRFTGWGAAALAAVLVATAAPAAAVVIDETASSAVETPAPAGTPAPEPTASPEPTETAVPAPAETATPEPAASPEATSPVETEATTETENPVESVGDFSARVSDAAIAAAALGDLTVTRFDDRYPDGLFDTSMVDGWGVADEKRAFGYVYLQASDGAWYAANAGADGDFEFRDIPLGDAKVYVGDPNSYVSTVFFDATGASSADDIERLPSRSISFSSGTFQNADGTTGTISGPSGIPQGEATVPISEAGSEVLIGMTSLRASANVLFDGGIVNDLADIEFGSGGEWFEATEWTPGTYEALGTFHLPDEIGLRVDPAPGYQVESVTAAEGGPLTVTERDGAYWIETTEYSTYFSRGDFTVTLEELPTGDLTVTRFDDRYPDGLFDPSKTAGDGLTDAKRTEQYVYLQTFDGSWWATGADAAGDFHFNDVPAGAAKVYVGHPNSYVSGVFFDATGAATADDIERLPNRNISFTDGTFLFQDGTTSSVSGPSGVPQGEAMVTISEGIESSALLGMTALRMNAEVHLDDGAAVEGLAEIDFGSGGEWFPGTEWQPGSFEAFASDAPYVYHLPDEIAVRIDPAAGYEIAEVASAAGTPQVREEEGVYYVDTTEFASYFLAGTLEVTLEAAPTATVDVTYFADVALDGVYESGVDQPVPGSLIYLQDAAGEWWATTSADDGYTFSGVAPGEARIYVQLPETGELPETPGMPEVELPEAAIALWDATDLTSYRDTVRAETKTISFEGTAIEPGTGATTPITVTDALVGEISADLEAVTEPDDPQQVLVGAASVLQFAAAVDSTTQMPVEGVELEFLANTEVAAATELEDGLGAYAATEENGDLAVFGAAEYGIRATPGTGYEIVDVSAINLVTGEILEVTEPSLAATGRVALFAATDEYRVAPQQVGGPFGAVVWTVQLAAVAPTDPGTTPGSDAPGFGLPPTGAQPAAVPTVRQLPATGSVMDAWAWMLTAGLLIAVGLTTRVVIRRRNA